MAPPPYTILGSVALGGIAVLGVAAIAQGMNGVVANAILNAILGVLIIVVLRRQP